jgi:protein-tyrosine-phosphatase
MKSSKWGIAMDFYSAVLTAGSILMGFCGTFLQFRIQREANYYRQPVASYDPVSGERSGTDVYIGLSHFTAAFLLSILATLFALCFGFVLPLIALVGPVDRPPLVTPGLIAPTLIMWGLLGSLIFLIGSFGAELIHYRILPDPLREYLSKRRDQRDRSRLGEVMASQGPQNGPVNIAFVDTGNCGRSVIAEILAKKTIRDADLNIVVIARGTDISPYEMHPEAPIVALLKDRDPDIEKHQAIQITSRDVRHSTLILTMTKKHKSDIISRFRSYRDDLRQKVFTLGEFAGRPRDVIDPNRFLNTDAEEKKYSATFVELAQLIPIALDRASKRYRP